MFPSTAAILEENVIAAEMSGAYHSFDNGAKTDVTDIVSAGTGTDVTGSDSLDRDYFNYHVSWLRSPTFGAGKSEYIEFDSQAQGRKPGESTYVAGFYDHDPKAAAAAAAASASATARTVRLRKMQVK